MSNNIIGFSKNWNNKLNNHAFTTIRLHNPKKYVLGNTYRIELNKKPLGTAVLTCKRQLSIDQLNDFICYLDLGYSRLKAIITLRRMYKDVNMETAVFDFCLLVYQAPSNQATKAVQTSLEL